MANKKTTKNNIIISSKIIFKTYGYKKATMNRIAKDAGINLSLMNYYFPRKQDILIDIMGGFLNTIYYFALLYSGNNPIVAYFATTHIYYDKLINDVSNLRFYKDVINREDKNDLSSYTNFSKVYMSIIKFLNINITHDDFVYREVHIFGALRELSNAYINKTIDISFSTLIDNISENACHILDISDYIINDSKDKSLKVIDKLEQINFQLFD